MSEGSENEVNDIMNNEGSVEEESTSEVVVTPEEEEESEPEESEPEESEPEESEPEESEPEESEPEEEPAPAPEESEGEEPEEEPAPAEEEEDAEEEPATLPQPEPEPEPELEEPSEAVEQVVSDIRDILSEEPVPSSESKGLTDDLKQRIAELDYLRECCENWVGSGRRGKSDFLTAWENKNVSVDSNVNYEDTLDQLEKLPEIVQLWAGKKFESNSNHFKNIRSYNLSKSLFNEKSVTEKVELVEQLVNLMTDCANGKIGGKGIILVINNLY